ncbi:MAG: hypothetical protein HGN29_13375, partial [Asgard group archaeon]|nr:hypothetical protein [Asgard group archaeon]
GLIVRREKTPGSITRNQIRTNINSWLKSKELQTNTFTDNELKKSMPNVIYKLGVKELIVLDKKEKGRADFLICLNDKKEFIKKEILRLL